MSSRREKALEAALKYATRGQHEKAAREYQTVVDEDPKDLRSWLLLAECLYKAGQTDKAVARYLQVARTYADDGQNEKALAVYRQVLALDPERMDVHLKCAQLYRNLRRMAEAIDAYETVAQACLRRGNGKDALALYRSVVELEPTSVNRRLRLAELYSREKMTDQAVAEFRTCAEQLRRDSQDAQFVRVAERLLFHAEDRTVLRQLIGVYNATGEARRALIKLNELLQRNPTDLEGLELLGETFIAVGKPDKALSVIAELVRNARHADGAGRATALRAVRMGLEAMPGQPDLVQALARLGGSRDALSDTAMIVDDEVEDVEGSFEDSGILEAIDDSLEVSDVSEMEEVEELQEFDDLSSSHDPGIDIDEPEEEEVSSTVVWNNQAQAQFAKGNASPATRLKPAELSGELAQQLEEARVLVKYRLFEYAESHLAPLLDKFPNHDRVLELKANLLEESGRAGESNDWRIKLAQTFVEQGEVDRAREQVAHVVTKDPAHTGAKRLLARLDGNKKASQEPRRAEQDAVVARTTPLARTPIAAPEPVAEDDFTISIDTGHKPVEAEVEEEDRFGLSEDDDGESTDSPSADHLPTPPLVAFSGNRVEDSGPITLGDLDLPPVDDVIASDEHEPVLQAEPSVGSNIAQARKGFAFDEPSDAFGSLAVEATRLNAATPASRPLAEPLRDPIAAQELADLSVDLGELDFFLAEELYDDAHELFRDLSARHPGHPALVPYAERMPPEVAQPMVATTPATTPTPAAAAKKSSAAAELGRLLSEEDADMALSFLEDAAAPLVEVDGGSQPVARDPSPTHAGDDDDDAYLSSIFGQGSAAKKSQTTSSARTEVQENDPAALFDLGLAYRDMGMPQAAIEALQASGRDPKWCARANVVLGEVLRTTGALPAALAAVQKALQGSTNDDERNAARYERAVIRQEMAQNADALADLQLLPSGWRDVDARLAQLREQVG